MRNRRNQFPCLAAAFLFCAGCGNLPGRPTQESIPIDPDNVTDFNFLY
jgi:hypothetical protein